MGLAIAAPIGPVNVEAIRRGLRSGFGPAVMVGCGSTAADLIYVALVYLGVAPLAQKPFFRVPLFLAAAVVLGFLAWEATKEALGKVSLPGTGPEQGRGIRTGALASGFLITISNPMTIVFYFSFFGGAVAKLHDAPRTVHLAYVGCVLAGCLLWSLLLAAALGWGRNWIGTRGLRFIGAASALALGCFALRFLLDGIREVGSLAG